MKITDRKPQRARSRVISSIQFAGWLSVVFCIGLLIASIIVMTLGINVPSFIVVIFAVVTLLTAGYIIFG